LVASLLDNSGHTYRDSDFEAENRMTSHLASAARIIGWSMASMLVLQLVLAYLLPRAGGVGMLDLILDGMLLFFILQPLLPELPALFRAPLPGPRGGAFSTPTGQVRYELDEREYVHGALLYHGLHHPLGVVRAFIKMLPVGGVCYALIVLSFAGAEPITTRMKQMVVAIPGVIGLSLLCLAWMHYYLRPLEAARAFRRKRGELWPADLSWTTNSVAFRNGEGRFVYPIEKCRAWKEDDSMILFHSGDRRYWRIPKRAFDADALARFRQILADNVQKLSPFAVIYRKRR
jgi:hypothetical protein